MYCLTLLNPINCLFAAKVYSVRAAILNRSFDLRISCLYDKTKHLIKLPVYFYNYCDFPFKGNPVPKTDIVLPKRAILSKAISI